MRLGTSLVSVWGSFFEQGDTGRLACNRRFLRDYISELPERGIESFEFTWDPGDTMEELFDDEWKEFLKQCQSELGLSFCVHLPQYGLDPAAPYEDVADASMRETIRAIECTKDLSITGYVLHMGISCVRLQASLSVLSPVLLENLWEKTVASARRTLPRLLDHVDAQRIWVENLPYAPLDMLVPVITDYDLGICLDVGHADRVGEDPAELFVRYKDRIGEIHFHDVKDPGSPGVIGSTTDHQALGSGHIGYRGLLDTFVQEGFEGDLLIEVLDPADERVSVERVRAYLGTLAGQETQRRSQ